MKITLEVTDSELDMIVYCLDTRIHFPGIAKEHAKEYKELANRLDEILNKSGSEIY